MPQPGRRILALLGLVAGLASTVFAASASATPMQMATPKYAAIIVDANTGEVLFQRKADAPRYPASITKVMTLYLTFEALTTGRLHLDDRVPFSTWATQQAPSKLGVPAGDSITVRQAILGLTVKSANDAAVALAERIGGTEARFAQLMTLRAQELGMTGTRYVNANGLPDARQVSNARDIAILARAVMRDYPQYYGFFDQPEMSWEGHLVRNQHSFLRKIPGVDGLKTGFTNAAGHNLVASAMRNGRRLVTVVLGANSSAARDENVADLMDAGFTVLDRRAHGQQVNVASLMDAPEEAGGPLSRALTEMGSAHDPEVTLVPRPVAPAPRPVRFATARSSAPAVDPAVADDCRHERGRALRRCRAAFHRAEREGVAVASSPASDCAGRRGRRARACRRAEAVQVASLSRSECAGLRGRHARACRREARAEARVQVASATPDCASRHGRSARRCRAEVAHVARAAAHGRRGVELAQARGRRHHTTLAVAELRGGRHARAARAHLAQANSTSCRRHPRSRACRALDDA